MNFYKKLIFTFFIIIFTFAILIKLVEPVIEKNLSNIFADKKLSKKLTSELIKSTENFTPEKREFYKNIIKKIYIKWKPLIEESIKEADQEINK
ncbi:MAG: hypothetical protein O3B39_04820 [Proteobacteria bacterium]|jgi:hypothetical protein|nr:hypothetical protein [Pseudomonadota bacterium]